MEKVGRKGGRGRKNVERKEEGRKRRGIISFLSLVPFFLQATHTYILPCNIDNAHLSPFAISFLFLCEGKG